MSAITGDTLSTYGAPYADYGTGQVDPTTDLPSASGNRFMAAISGMTQTAFSAWCSFLSNGASAPTLGAHQELWGSVGLAAPVVARTAPGVCTITYPVSVQDEIPLGATGYTGPVGLNIVAGHAQVRFSALPAWIVSVSASANVVTLTFASVASSGTTTIADPTGLTVDVWSF